MCRPIVVTKFADRDHLGRPWRSAGCQWEAPVAWGDRDFPRLEGITGGGRRPPGPGEYTCEG